jgi:HAD superfamily hydrolase (TIGR01549 family)
MRKLYVFDLDGVLIDSEKNMEVSWRTVQKEHQVNQAFSEYFKHIGKPFKDILTAIGITKKHSAIQATYERASLEHIGEIQPYVGVVETLSQLKEDHKTAIVTSKSYLRTQEIIRGFPAFDYVCCPTEGLRGKPAPDQLLYTMAKCNMDPDDTVYIGDMESDYKCARRAGVQFIFAEWGYGHLLCDYSLDSIKALISPIRSGACEWTPKAAYAE